jgi:putative transposase
MANKYTQINIHLVFSVKGRENVINSFKDDLCKYIGGILKNQRHYPLSINGYKDHIHLFFELNPNISISETVKVVKANSSKWINENKFVKGKFYWQEGYGGFSYSKSQRKNVIQYIENQEEHHKKRSFREEYLDLLKKYEIQFSDNYLFEFYE